MRLTLTRNIPRIIIYLGLLVLLLSLVVLSGNYSKSNPNGKSSPIKIQGTQTQNSDQVAFETDSSDGDENSANTSQNTSSLNTRIRVSVDSNTTNNETTGHTNIEVTQNGETQDFSNALSECLSAGNINIDIGDSEIDCESEDGRLEIDWNSDNDQRTKTKTSSSQDIEIDNN